MPTELLSILASGLSLEHRDAVRQAYLGIVPIDAGRQKNTLAALDAVLRGAPDCGRAPSDPRRTPRAHDNRQAQAIEIVAKRVPELLDWPEGKALELMDMASDTPEMPVVRTSNPFDEDDVLRLWRSGEAYFSGRALGESTPAPRSGIDGFFDALEQEMSLGGFAEGSDGHGIGPLRAAFAEALSPVPAPIESSAPLTAQALPALPEAAALAPPDPAAQEGLGILADWIETGNWASEAGDLVPQVCTLLPGWPADRALVVHHGGLFPSVFGTTREGRMSVEIHRENNHYSALVDGERVDVPGDGDCFFHATIMALGKKDAQALTVDADREVQAARMRTTLADFVRAHPREISPWVDWEKIVRTAGAQPDPAELSPEAASASPASDAPDLQAQADVGRSKILQDELLALARKNRKKNPGRPPLSRKIINEHAIRHGFAPSTLSKRINVRGELMLQGHAIQQKWEKNQTGSSFKSPSAALLKRLQAQAKNGNTPVRLADELITEIGKTENVSISYLRSLIRANGDYTASGQAIVDLAADSFQQDKQKYVTRAILLHLQEKSRSGRLSLITEATELSVLYPSLKSAIHASGKLTKRGEKIVDPQNEKPNKREMKSITSDFLREIQRKLKNKETIADLCEERKISARSVFCFIEISGEFTVRGKAALYLSELQGKGLTQSRVSPAALKMLQDHAKSAPLTEEFVFEFSKKMNMSFTALRQYVRLNGEISRQGRDFLNRNTPAMPAHVSAVAQVRDVPGRIRALLDKGRTEAAQKVAQALLQPALLTQLNSAWTAGRTEMSRQEAAAMNAANAGYMDLLKILVDKELLGARQVFDQVFFGLSEEASYHIHIASRISSADQPGGGASTARMAQALTQLLGVLAHGLEHAEGSDARRRMRRDLLLPYPQQVSVLDKLHYRKYEDFFSRAVLAGGVRNLHHASLIAARGLNQAWLLPGLDDGLSRKRAHKFETAAQSGLQLTPGELPASGIELSQVQEGLDQLDLEGKYTARVAKRARLDEEAQARRVQERREKAIMGKLQAVIRAEVNDCWESLARQTRKRHAAPGVLGILEPVGTAIRAKEAASVPTTAPEPLVNAVRKALMATPQGKAAVQKLLESGEAYSREAHPQFHAVLQRIAAANAGTTQENYAQRIRQNAACTIAALQAHDKAVHAQRAAERDASEQQQTLDVQARSQSQSAGPEAGSQAGSTAPAIHLQSVPDLGGTAELVRHLPIPSIAHFAWPLPPSATPVASTRAEPMPRTQKPRSPDPHKEAEKPR